MKKILIVTYYYKQKNAMASVRAIKLAKYLSRKDYNVYVLTSNQIDTWTKNYQTPIPDQRITEIYAPQEKRWTYIRAFLDHRKKRGQARISNMQSKGAPGNKQKTADRRVNMKTRLINWAKWLFYFNVAKQEDLCMFEGLKKAFYEQKCPKFDTVIATYPTYGAFLMGMWLKKHGHCKRLIADFRDPLYNPGFRNKKQEGDYDLNCLRKIVKTADRIVCVSHGIAEGIRQAIPCDKAIDVITNGYDPEDVEQNDLEVAFDKEKFHFVYTGTLYHGKRCVDMLADVLREMIDEGLISKAQFAFQYAGPDFPLLLAQLKAYGLEETAVDHGFVSREMAIAMQKAADALLLLTWNEKTYQGVVPGKLFEYMAIGTVPTIALITGDIMNSEVAQLIRQAQAGIACEAAVPADREKLKEFVVGLLSREAISKSRVDEYSYEKISGKYMQLM